MRRVVLYCCSAVVGSSIGSMWTWTTEEWSDANPLTAGLLPALFSLGPAIAIVGVARLWPSAVAFIAGILAAAMMVMWGLFASSDSSTSALIFLSGWYVGVPSAIVVVIFNSRRNGPAATNAVRDDLHEPLDPTR